MEYLTWITTLAQQAPIGLPPNVWQVVAQSGFNAVLILILLYFGRNEIGEIRRANDRNINEIRKSQDRNTKMVTLALIQIAALVPGSRQQLESLKTEIDQVEHDDAKP